MALSAPSHDASGLMKQIGTAAFTTTGTTVAVKTKFKNIKAVFIAWNGAAAGDGAPSYAISGGTVTVSRAAGTTSGLGFSIIVYGL